MSLAVIVDTPAALAAALARRLTELVPRALQETGRFALALPGGSVAEAFFPVLRAAAVPWQRCDFFWGDERAVPPTHPDSNYRQAAELWLQPAAVPSSRVHRLRGEASDLDAAAREHQAELALVLGGSEEAPTVPRLDLVLLGMGPDGHVASLFPGHPLLAEEQRWVAALDDAPKPPPRRLTLTLPVLAGARLVVVAALGAAKSAAVHAARTEAACTLPVARVLRQAPQALLLLDPPAAAGG